MTHFHFNILFVFFVQLEFLLSKTSYFVYAFQHLPFFSNTWNRPYAARVSGVVEESPGPLEYEVALYRESTNNDEVSNDLPVDQAVVLGTKLQLRATITTDSGEKWERCLVVNDMTWKIHFFINFLLTSSASITSAKYVFSR